MKIENITAIELQKIDKDAALFDIRGVFVQLHRRYFHDSDIQKARGITRKELLSKYIILRTEMQRRGLEPLVQTELDKEVHERIAKKRIWGLDVGGLSEVVVKSDYVCIAGEFLKAPKDAAGVEIVVNETPANASGTLEASVGKLVREEVRKEASFTYAEAGPEGSHIPLYDLVLRPKPELRRREVAAKQGWGLGKPAHRLFVLADLAKTPGFKEGRAVVEAKFDGVRTKITKQSGKVTITTDPEELKGSPDKTKRLPWQAAELEKMAQDNFILDAEVVICTPEQCLHRTAVNALINGKFDPTERSKRAHVYVFDILRHNGRDTKSFPLKERKEVLSAFKDSAHVHFLRPSVTLARAALSYVVDLEKLEYMQRAMNKIMGYAHKGGAFPKHISEGIMVKRLDAPYQAPQAKSWAKWKERFEVDALVVGKHEIIREGKPTDNFNYELAVGPISKEWADAIAAKDKKAVIERGGKWYNWIGKTDNTKQKVAEGKILRVASEDINKFETAEPKFPYYKAYISVVLQPVPEKSVPDKMAVLERLSVMTAPREAMVEKGVKEDVGASVEAGKIPKEIYDEHAKPNEPLPKEFYNAPREGRTWMQTHIRGLEPEQVKAYKAGKISMGEMLEGHSIHVDIRMNLGEKKLIQWVVTDNQVKDYLNMLRGTRVPTAAGVMNVAKSFALVKPSAEEPQEIRKVAPGLKEAAINPAGARVLADLQIKAGSYFIPAGGVGATAFRDTWMGLIWRGTVRTGVQRKDYHEYFFTPEKGLPKDNAQLLNGRFVVKAFKRKAGKGNYWQIWKAVDKPVPADPIEHKDGGYLFPVPAEELTRMGREFYDYGKKEPVK